MVCCRRVLVLLVGCATGVDHDAFWAAVAAVDGALADEREAPQTRALIKQVYTNDDGYPAPRIKKGVPRPDPAAPRRGAASSRGARQCRNQP